MTIPRYPVAQIAYFVEDIEVAAQKMYATVGAGPFFVVNDIQLNRGVHRGDPCLFVHSSAYGQWGDVMLELVQQETDGPSPFRDLYLPGEGGLHHLATIVPNQQEAYAAYQSAGYEIATIAETTGGTEFAFVDAIASLGHFIEVYESTHALLKFYHMVKTASQGWSGEQLIRQL
jgi:hypothetical protein